MPADPTATKVTEARRISNLAPLSEDLWASISTRAIGKEIAAGKTVHRQGDTLPHTEIVLSGLARVYVTAPDGRTLTIRYCRKGSLLGVASLFHHSFTLPASIQAVTDVEMLGLDPAVLQRAADRHPTLARAFLAELSERAMAFLSEIPGGAFASVDQRVARHLLDLASATQEGSDLVAALGQQELAEAVGSVREVVVRALGSFRSKGLIETGRQRIVILDPERLLEESYRNGT